MTEDAIDKLNHDLQRNSAVMSWGLGFLVVFSLTMMVIMMWAMYHIGQNSTKIQQLGEENRVVLCNLKKETSIRLRIFSVDSVGIMPDKIRIPLVASYRATAASFSTLECKG